MNLDNQSRIDAGSVIPVVRTMSADLITPLAVYLKLAADGTESFLLESVEGGEALARYSFIGTDPYLTATGNDKRTEIRDNSGTRRLDRSVLSFLRGHFAGKRLVPADDLPSFVGGAIGIMGFSCAAWFEPVLKHSMKNVEEEAAFMFCRTVVAFDHAKQVIRIITLVFADEAAGDRQKLEELIRKAENINKNTADRLENEPIRLPDDDMPGEPEEIVSNYERDVFEHDVRRVKESIAAGDAYQVVLSQCFSRRTSASPVAIYRAMRSLNPSPYMFLIRMDGRSLIGASPEMLVRCRGEDLEYRPIAGTRPRGKTDEEDTRLA